VYVITHNRPFLLDFLYVVLLYFILFYACPHIQGLVGVGLSGFKSRLRHHRKSEGLEVQCYVLLTLLFCLFLTDF